MWPGIALPFMADVFPEVSTGPGTQPAAILLNDRFLGGRGFEISQKGSTPLLACSRCFCLVWLSGLNYLA